MEQVQHMRLGRHASLQRLFQGAQHVLLVMMQHQQQDLDHLTIAAGLAQHLPLQLTERLWHFDEGRTIA